MRIFNLKRTHLVQDIGLFGVLDDEGLPFVLSCENTKLYIPKGEYVCKKARYNAGGYDTYEIIDVPNRDHILFHCGNIDSQSQGCILLGEEFAPLLGRAAGVAQSKYGFAEFMARTKNEDAFKLVILEHF